MKHCKRCDKIKDLSKFSKNGKYKGRTKYKPICKDCKNTGRIIIPLNKCHYEKCNELTKTKYCSTICSNKGRATSKRVCYCGTDIMNKLAKYCSQTCSARIATAYHVNDWLDGKEKGWTGKTRALSKYIRGYLKDTRGSSCESCGWDGKHPSDGKSLTEIDHIDGNAENCTPDNLKILCPNCHAMTPTFRARNPTSKRQR